DVDMVVCTPLPQEEVKRRIAAHNERVHLVPSKTPGMNYRVLRYGTDASDSCSALKLIKVDVLVAEENLCIPSITSDRILHVNGWPLPPLSFLFLLRLQGWSDHRHAELDHHREKTEVDVTDLSLHLVPYCLASAIAGGRTLWDDAQQYLPDRFLRLSRARAAAFVYEHPWAADDWATLGFPATELEIRRPIASPFSLLVEYETETESEESDISSS
ncbi:hypothetical protein EXIGLDRAFT_622428, partial [Exidia glandulosa HHB12029]